MNLGFDVRYTLGLSNIAISPYFAPSKAYNSVFQFDIFYLFGK
jgi:hypothetical protein